MSTSATVSDVMMTNGTEPAHLFPTLNIESSTGTKIESVNIETTTAKMSNLGLTDVTTMAAPKKVQSIVLTSTSGSSDYSNLKMVDEDYPKFDLDSDMVVVRVKAVGLNFAELMQRQGLYKPAVKTPYTPGYEGAGVVESVGLKCSGIEGKKDVNVGDRVIVFHTSGMWKDVVCVPRSHVIPIPETMSFEDAAGMPVNYITAYQMLHRMAHIKEGDSILIHMAAGGVGTAATQLCRLIPGVVIFGTASAAKHDYLKQNGVDHPIDYTTSDYVEEVKKICPKGIDIVLDPLNGENAIKGYELLRPMGKIIHYGASSLTSESRSYVTAFKVWWKSLTVNSIDIMSENKGVYGYHLGTLAQNPDMLTVCTEDMAKILELHVQGKLSVKKDSIFTFSKVGEAFRRMHCRKNLGKIVMIPDREMDMNWLSPEIAAMVNTQIVPTKKQRDEAKAKEQLEADQKAKAEKEEKERLVKQEAERKAEEAKKAAEEEKKAVEQPTA